ncbi:MAG: hypothetical protein G01um101491_180 [Parcubacteria group bacterium Gr01-1014_91]|nr:MAG: hypothetical protein G01um101491_180 [Parcubacteria group bacterium Gr01-1014_91]
MYKDLDSAWLLRQAFLGRPYEPSASIQNCIAAAVIVLLLATTAIRW